MRPTPVFSLALLCACGEVLRPVDASVGDGAAVAAWEDPARRVRVELFDWGADARTPVADFLFVLDPSVSMAVVLDRVEAAIDALPEAGVFPAKARVGVMNMVPGSFTARRRPHPGVTSFPGLGLLPGFLALVDGDAIARFRTVASPDLAAAYAIDGCGPWFAPDERNAAGVSCLTAATQIPLANVGVEAGLTALGQLLTAHLGTPLFRPGAAVNVIFVSDTHDPGVPRPYRRAETEELVPMMPDAETLVSLIQRTQPVSAVRLHGIVPLSECGELWSPAGDTYRRAIEASGGALLDVCTAEDYAPFIRAIADHGAQPTQAVFPLGRPAEAVEEVRVDNQPRTWTVVGDVVTVPGLRREDAGEVEVRYRFEPPGLPSPAASRGPGRRAPGPAADVAPARPVAPTVPLAPAQRAPRAPVGVPSGPASDGAAARPATPVAPTIPLTPAARPSR